VSRFEKSQAEKRGASPAAQERRGYPRYPFSASAEAVHIQPDTRLSGRVSDLGRGGCYIDTINPFPVGADVKIRIVKDNASFVAQARVLYAGSGMGMGLAFTKIEPERLLVLEGWLRELSGESKQSAKALEDDEPASSPVATSAGNEQRNVLNELIVTLIRKQVLTDAEGKALLRKLMD
jgi:hypothetical protein